MLKVGIVGCGKIADAHASQIQRIKSCEIVGVCDRELLMARQLSERFPVKRYFDNLPELLSAMRPDVVHVTTPAESHFAIAKLCLESGCHVYVEKPFTLYADEARTLLELAQEKVLKVTVGHDDQFSHVTRRMRNLVNAGSWVAPSSTWRATSVMNSAKPTPGRYWPTSNIGCEKTTWEAVA